MLDSAVLDRAISCATEAPVLFHKCYQVTGLEKEDRPIHSSRLAGLWVLTEPEGFGDGRDYKLREGKVKYEKGDPEEESEETDADDDEHSLKQNWRVDIQTFTKNRKLSRAVLMKNPRVREKDLWDLKMSIEAKTVMRARDIFQTAKYSIEHMMKRLWKGLPVDRVYLQVWSSKAWKGAVLDIIGYARVKKGKIVQESFTALKETYESHPSAASCFSIEEMTLVLESAVTELRGEHDYTRRQYPDGKYPVGVLFVDGEEHPLPEKNVSKMDIGNFYLPLFRIHYGDKFLSYSIEKLEQIHGVRKAEMEKDKQDLLNRSKHEHYREELLRKDCGLCENLLTSACKKCEPQSSCKVAIGVCGHAYHRHCLEADEISICPGDSLPWEELNFKRRKRNKDQVEQCLLH